MKSYTVRQGLAEASNSIEGYHEAIKLLYGVALSAAAKSGDTDVIKALRVHLDGLFAVWLPEAKKGELDTLFQNLPTFYDACLLIQGAIKRKEVNADKFLAAVDEMLNFLGQKGILGVDDIEEEWKAFKVGLVIQPNEEDVLNKKAEE